MAVREQPVVRPPRVFRGWWVVAGVFLMLMTTAGLGFYGLPVYLRALTAERGFSVGAVSGATAVFFIVSGLVGLPVGAYVSRRDPRPMIAAGAVGGGLALLLLGRVSEVWQVYAVYALFGVCFAAAGLVPGTTIVTRWFSRRRSVALAVASTGLSAGGVFLTPLAAALIRDRGLPDSAPLLALIFVLGVVPGSALLVRSSPESVGLLPDGDRTAEPGAPARTVTGVPLAEALRTRFYRAVTLAQLLALLAQVGGIAHLVNLVAQRR